MNPLSTSRQRRERPGSRRLGGLWAPLALITFAFAAAPVFASAVPDDDVLRAGAEVYTSVCSSCHQPGGVGLSGDYPPLLDNPNVQDTEYVRTVIAEGRSGQIVVNGETYDGVMPAQSTLSDADVDNVIAYIQSGFAAPSAPEVVVETGPAAGTELPPFSAMMIAAAALLTVGLFVLVLGPRVVGAHDRRTLPWVDAWMKTAVIVVGLIVALVFVPSRVLEVDAVQDLPPMAQDLIAVGLWSAGLVAGLWALWYAHREQRV